MKRCLGCGKDYGDELRRCPSCGKSGWTEHPGGQPGGREREGFPWGVAPAIAYLALGSAAAVVLGFSPVTVPEAGLRVLLLVVAAAEILLAIGLGLRLRWAWCAAFLLLGLDVAVALFLAGKAPIHLAHAGPSLLCALSLLLPSVREAFLERNEGVSVIS